MRINIKVDGECSMENVHDKNEVRCERCGSLAVEEGYDMQLCCECRKELSRRPIPKSIIIFYRNHWNFSIIAYYEYKGY